MERVYRDVIVVGAGPGGSTCAAYLARAGVDTLLVDKDVYPRDKPCADAQSGNTLKHVKELGAYDELKKIAMEGHHLKMVSASYEETVAGDENFPVYVTITPRWEFDDLMRKTAIKHGAEMLEGAWVYDVIKEDGYVKGVKCKYQGEDIEIYSKIVIGADGSHSIVAKKVGLFPENHDSVCQAVRTYFTGVELDPKLRKDGYIEFDFDGSVAPAYFWVFPSGKRGLKEGFCNVGTGIIDRSEYGTKKYNKETLVEIIERWMKTSPYGKQFENARQCAPWKGWRVPDTQQRTKDCGNGFMLIGDAGSTVIPLVDEGISGAMDSAEMAANAAIKALKEENYSEEFLYKNYPTEFTNRYSDRLKKIKLAQESLVDPNVCSKLVHKMNQDEKVKERALITMFRN